MPDPLRGRGPQERSDISRILHPVQPDAVVPDRLHDLRRRRVHEEKHALSVADLGKLFRQPRLAGPAFCGIEPAAQRFRLRPVRQPCGVEHRYFRLPEAVQPSLAQVKSLQQNLPACIRRPASARYPSEQKFEERIVCGCEVLHGAAGQKRELSHTRAAGVNLQSLRGAGSPDFALHNGHSPPPQKSTKVMPPRVTNQAF